MKAAEGILTQLGGMTSHAAVVARGMGTTCVSGCSDIKVDVENEIMTYENGKQFLKRGDGMIKRIRAKPPRRDG